MAKRGFGKMWKWDRGDLLGALGLDGGFGRWIGPAAIGFGVGALVGATVALLSAPRTGAELRGEILTAGRRVIQRKRVGLDELGEESRPETH